MTPIERTEINRQNKELIKSISELTSTKLYYTYKSEHHQSVSIPFVQIRFKLSSTTIQSFNLPFRLLTIDDIAENLIELHENTYPQKQAFLEKILKGITKHKQDSNNFVDTPYLHTLCCNSPSVTDPPKQ